jgi:hypothetical protein
LFLTATQVVLRTDWFSGSGWLATHEVMQESYAELENPGVSCGVFVKLPVSSTWHTGKSLIHNVF